MNLIIRKTCLIVLLFCVLLACVIGESQANQDKPKNAESSEVSERAASDKTGTLTAAATPAERERMLLERIEQLERRLADIESRISIKPVESTQPAPAKETIAASIIASPKPSETRSQKDEDRSALDFLRDTTINVTLDGYYGYNFNRPAGRVNLLRAYDVSSNSFSLNQAAVVIERAAKPEAGRRFGLRLDLQYGQATETVQGNANNELRPQAYRPIWQAYGTYIVPVGEGLTIDFGKWASNLGYETNYTKDNFNYSRSYFYNFLPFYHFGLRAKYPVNDKVALQYQLMNGIQQSEDFNGFKSQEVSLILTPTKSITGQINYYVGREQRDVVADLNPTFPSLPTQPGLPTTVIRPEPRGRFHALDAYLTWNATDKLILAGQADYTINRVEEFSPPTRVTGGALYARYQFTPIFALAGRGEYLSDHGGLFSGLTQTLKETTLTADFKVTDGFLLRGEWRRDFSNQAFFLTEVPGIRKKEQNTATVGLIWWLGRKEGTW